MHYRFETFGHIGHHPLLRALPYLVLAGGGLIALYEHSPGSIVLLLVAAGLALAVAERVRKVPGLGRSVAVAPSGLPLGDGGCFPGGAPRRERPTASSVVVIDGGSVDRQRDRGAPRSTSHRNHWFSRTRGLRTLHQQP